MMRVSLQVNETMSLHTFSFFWLHKIPVTVDYFLCVKVSRQAGWFVPTVRREGVIILSISLVGLLGAVYGWVTKELTVTTECIAFCVRWMCCHWAYRWITGLHCLLSWGLWMRRVWSSNPKSEQWIFKIRFHMSCRWSRVDGKLRGLRGNNYLNVFVLVTTISKAQYVSGCTFPMIGGAMTGK